MGQPVWLVTSPTSFQATKQNVGRWRQFAKYWSDLGKSVTSAATLLRRPSSPLQTAQLSLRHQVHSLGPGGLQASDPDPELPGVSPGRQEAVTQPGWEEACGEELLGPTSARPQGAAQEPVGRHRSGRLAQAWVLNPFATCAPA